MPAGEDGGDGPFDDFQRGEGSDSGEVGELIGWSKVDPPEGRQRDAQRLVAALQELPGVSWAGVNTPLRRAVIALEPSAPKPSALESSAAPTLAELVDVVDRVDRDHLEKTGLGDTGTVVGAGTVAAPPTDRGRVDQALWALAANAAGLVASSAGAAVRLTPMPVELAALITAVDVQPRVRQLLEALVGRPATDVGLAILSAAGQGLAGGWFGLAVDAAQRVSALGEAGAAHDAWRAREGELLADAQHVAAEPVVVERPRLLPPGQVEVYAEPAALVGLAAAAVALPATGNPRRAAALALAAVPKAARVGREAFATGLVRLISRRGAVVLDSVALRRLDRIDTVVLDADAVGPEVAEALAAVAHRAGVRQVVRGGGPRLLGTVRSLQSTGAVVLLVSGHREALGNADVGIGVSGADDQPPWGAHVLVGNDLELAAVVIEACAAARQVSRRGVLLSQAGSVLGAVGALTTPRWGSGPARAAMLGVNGAAAGALVHGRWACQQLGRGQLIVPISQIAWHAMPVDDALDEVKTTPEGLSECRSTTGAARRADPSNRLSPAWPGP
ncbi:MAG: hypothetical protein WCC38_13305 [Pseudonocardiaceae bacterium]